MREFKYINPNTMSEVIVIAKDIAHAERIYSKVYNNTAPIPAIGMEVSASDITNS